MKALVQRVARCSVRVDDEIVASISQGVLVLVGVEIGDSEAEARWLANKVAAIRVFPSEQKPMDRSLVEVGGAALVVSQFTLVADTRKGNRPSFSRAAAPDIAEPLVEQFVAFLAERLDDVKTGVFGAHMEVELVNDGPVTLLLQREP